MKNLDCINTKVHYERVVDINCRVVKGLRPVGGVITGVLVVSLLTTKATLFTAEVEFRYSKEWGCRTGASRYYAASTSRPQDREQIPYVALPTFVRLGVRKMRHRFAMSPDKMIAPYENA